MSSSLALAAVTEALRSLLDRRVNAAPDDDPASDPELAGTQVTTRPPDRARVNMSGNQLNLFLYLTSPNAAWRNLAPPDRLRPGEQGQPPLALDLHYLLTAYGRDDDDAAVLAQRLLGRAMSVLHDHAVLSRDEVGAALPGNDLHEQLERIRITPEEMALEELSRLWAAFQTHYRISASYAATVVLIDSTRPTSAPLPVLRRGEEDGGVRTVTGAAPTLVETRADVEPPAFGASARLGASLRVLGRNLASAHLVASFAHPHLEAAVEGPLEPVAETAARGLDPAHERRFALADEGDDPQALERWAPGLHTLTLREERPGVPPWTSNAVAFALAPAIAVAPLAASAGDVALTVTCRPRLRSGQRVLLLFGAQQVLPGGVDTPVDASQPSSATFTVPGVPVGTYTVRLRVDGVDSLPLAAPAEGRRYDTAFDPQQQVVVT